MELIAEIGQAHDGSLGILHSYIDRLSKVGIKIIKFQMHIAEAESSEWEPFRINFSYEDDTRYDYWSRMSFSELEWKGIKEHCDSNEIEFLCTPFSMQSVDVLERLNVKRYKIGSADATNKLLLNKIAKTKKEVIMSTGMSNFEDLDCAVEIFKKHGVPFSLLYCVSKYPSTESDIDLNSVNILKERYDCQVGFSDHSGKIWPLVAASALGADKLEFHAVFDKEMFGPDASASLEIQEIHTLIELSLIHI